MAQPPVGTVDPSKLYVDRQSRQIWLGVETSVDPGGSILVSDIAALIAADTTTLNSAKAYTDAQILTRAPTSHTHTASQVTDFTTAVQAVIAATPQASIPPGLIAMYSGSMANIGVGPWAGWRLCDGGGGTPDLRDKFILGAGNMVPGTKNTPADIATDTAGAHSHGGATSPTTLAVGHLPAHHHGPGSLRGSDSFSGTTGAAGSHNHVAGDAILGGSLGGTGLRAWTNTGQPSGFTDTEPAHSHSFSGSVTVNITTGVTADTGSDIGHSHPIPADSGHVHTITAASLKIRSALSWYALAYVMKL